MTVFIFVVELHDGPAPHEAPAPFWLQAPLALQVPVRQSPEQPVSGVVAALAEQVPCPFRLHAMQVPHEGAEQQTPSTQFPLSQSEALLQPAPSTFCVPQTLPAQTTELAQGLPTPELQLPAPSQVFGVRVEPVQVEPQAVPLAPFWQCPAPSHMPVVPQVVFESVQVLCPALPAGTGRHCPSLCPFRVFVHAKQPLQSLLQQTPSATTPDVH